MERYETLKITNRFMFAKVFSHEDVAKDFLQDVLKITIEKISVVAEATTEEDPFHRGVRFDVIARDDSPGSSGIRYFDIEMQMDDTGELPKRARYYQSMCDLDALAKGAAYDELGAQYIIFISPKDIFGKGRAIYSFQNRDEADPNIVMGDLCYKNFYIFKKYKDIKDEAIREYMQYFATQKCKSKKMKRIHDLVEQYHRDPFTKKAYMTLEQELKIRYKKGREEGRAEGRAEGRVEGRAEGRAEGRVEGANSTKKELAKAFRDAGFPVEVISEKTGLSVAEIKAL